MTDYTDLIARLRATVPSVYDCKNAADALEAQARRIAELDKLYLSSEYMRKLKDDRIAELEAALSDTTAHLVAAVSLLERGGKKAAPSNTMFAQMLVDHKNSIDRARAALGEKE